MTRMIPLTQGKHAIVDDDDFEWLNQWKWYALKTANTYYAARKVRGRTVLMHRVVLGLDIRDKRHGEHKNGAGLDNRRTNLRIATPAQNQANQRLQKKSRSGYKGVKWVRRDKRWMARIKVSGKTMYLGYFKNPVDAAKAYDEAARKHFGEFANTNF